MRFCASVIRGLYKILLWFKKFFALIISKTDKKVTMGRKSKFLTDNDYSCNFASVNQNAH